MAQQLYSQHPYNGSMFASSIYGSAGGGLAYGSGAAAAGLLPQITATHQQALSLPQYQPSQLHHLGIADSRGWPLPQSSALDVSLGLKRPIEEDSLSASLLSKRARVDNLIPQRLEPVASIPLYPQRPGEKFCTFYMSTSICKFGAACKFDHPAWVPAGGIPNWKENTSAKPENPVESSTYPERPGEPDCAFYMKTGLCKYGSNCRYNHPNERPAGNPPEAPQTEDKESQDKMVSLNSKGLPLRPGQTDCVFYTKTGSCKYGDRCKFNHPQNIADLKPSIPAVPQMAVSHPALLTSFGVANTFGLAGASYTLPLTGHPYPLRPGEPECTFYIKNGICKFGQNCKFNHPLNRLDPIYATTVKLTAGGLPRREWEPPCPYYLKTGGCSFLANCKYDHPPPEEFAAKAASDPAKLESALDDVL